MNKLVLFGHHFAAIAGAGPLVGPVLAGTIRVFSRILMDGDRSSDGRRCNDFVILVASIRHDAKSLAEIAKVEISRLSGTTASVAILIILIVAMAGLGLVVVNSLSESSWGTFTIAATIPIALLMGIWMLNCEKEKLRRQLSVVLFY